MSIVLTLAVFVTWIVFAAALSALGVCFLHCIGRVESSWEHAYFGVWSGLALLTLALLAWHFFFPIDHIAVILIVAVVAAASLAERRWFAALLTTPVDWALAVALMAIGLWTANHALGRPGMDDYNYEFQAIRWFHDYRLVPGLANLHGRLGFNNAHHLIGALFSTGFWQGRVHHVVNGFAVALSLSYLVYAIRQAVTVGREARASWMIPALLISPCAGLVLFGVFGPVVSTLKADVLVAAGLAVLSCVYVQSATSEPGSTRFAAASATVLLMSGLLFGVKVNAAAFSLILAGAAGLRLVVNVRTDKRIRRVATASCLVGGGLIAGTLLRGVILSGYPLYPLDVFGLPVDWRVPAARARSERLFIKAWAQLRPTYEFEVLQSMDWLLPWARSLVLTEKFGIVLPAVMTVVLAAALAGNERPDRRSLWTYGVPAGASCAALVVWFTQAPAARFASMYFWILFAAVAAWSTRSPARQASRILSIAAAVVLLPAMWAMLSYVDVPDHYRPGVMMVVVFGLVWALAFQAMQRSAPAVALLCALLAVSQIGERGAAHILSGRVTEAANMLWYGVDRLDDDFDAAYLARQTRSGLTVYEAKAARYDTPLPNTRYFNPFLEARDPRRLDRGFRNIAPHPMERGYSVDYVIQPNGGREIVRPQP